MWWVNSIKFYCKTYLELLRSSVYVNNILRHSRHMGNNRKSSYIVYNDLYFRNQSTHKHTHALLHHMLNINSGRIVQVLFLVLTYYFSTRVYFLKHWGYKYYVLFILKISTTLYLGEVSRIFSCPNCID